MQPNSKLFIYSFSLAILLLCIHEYYFRVIEGFSPGYDVENLDYWAEQRAKVDNLSSKDIIIIGSSRAHFDININLWDSITDTKPLMLAYPGSSPLLALDDLVKKSQFNGLIVLGVSPGLFFGMRDSWGSGRIKKAIDQYYDRTYAQALNHILYKLPDNNLGYVNQSISLAEIFASIKFPKRDSVITPVIWPPMIHMDENRNIRMLPIMENDTTIQRRQKDIWFNPNPKNRYADSLQVILNDYIGLIKLFKERGGRVAFIRPPVTDYYLKTEGKLFPRESYWDELIRQSGCPGYHFADYQSTKNMVPPEWSHLNRKDSDTYTKTIIQLLKQDNLL